MSRAIRRHNCDKSDCDAGWFVFYRGRFAWWCWRKVSATQSEGRKIEVVAGRTQRGVERVSELHN